MTPTPDSQKPDDLRDVLIFLRSLALAFVAWVEKRYGLKRRH